MRISRGVLAALTASSCNRKTIVLGGDVRLTSESLKLALAKGLQDAGVDVLDIGLFRHGRDLFLRPSIWVLMAVLK
ncbi:phosphomannomutase [Citrobacter koseri]|uniref:Phosphomannomutase n=1 Tax=Citrobacter koseri TaxID=545 RepID=A0A2X2VKK6_CITKO|nr:phosphomannomutase [Citrobacter koseri]